MSPALLTFIQGIVASLMVLGGVWITAKIGAKSTRRGQDQQHEIDWFEKLSNKVDKQDETIAALQSRIEKLEDEVHQKGQIIVKLGDYLNSLSLYVRFGRQGPYPRPDEELSDCFNTGRWGQIADEHDDRYRQNNGATD